VSGGIQCGGERRLVIGRPENERILMLRIGRRCCRANYLSNCWNDHHWSRGYPLAITW
jgi:hypothetical protein